MTSDHRPRFVKPDGREAGNRPGINGWVWALFIVLALAFLVERAL